MESSSNSKQAMWVAIGQFCAYAIGIVSPMILSRYFDKGDYGTYKQVMYVYSTLTTVFTFGIPRAYSYFIPRVALGESRDVIRKITNIFICIGTFFSALLFLGSPLIAQLLKNPDLEIALKYFAPTPLFLMPVVGLDCILASYKKTQFLALYSISTKVFTLVCIILPVILFKGTYVHAIIGFDIASFITFLLALYLRNIPTKDIPLEKTTVTIRDILHFSLPLMVASIWIMIFQSANQFFVSRYYGNETFADFSNGFIEFPIIPMVVNSVATVLMPVFSGMLVNNREGIKDVWTSALSKSVKITYPMAVFSVVFSSLIMICFYGDIYQTSGIYFLIKNFEGFFAIIPFYPILLALGKTKEYSNIHMAMAIAIVPLEFLVVKLGLPATMIGVVFVLCSFTKVVLQFIIVSKSVNLSFRDLIPYKDMLMVGGVAAVSTIVPYIFVARHSEINKYLLLVLSVMIFVIIYYALCWLMKITYKDIVEGYLSKSKLRGVVKLIP